MDTRKVVGSFNAPTHCYCTLSFGVITVVNENLDSLPLHVFTFNSSHNNETRDTPTNAFLMF